MTQLKFLALLLSTIMRCTILSTTSHAQIKDGVYMYSLVRTDSSTSVGMIGDNVITRTLTVKNDSSLIKLSYYIMHYNGKLWSCRGITGLYQLTTKKDSLYNIKNDKINISITVLNKDSIEVEECSGVVELFYSGGAYYSYPISLMYAKHTLVYSPALSEAEEKKQKD